MQYCAPHHCKPQVRHGRRAQGGFTLIELVMVIVLMGFVSAMLTGFLKTPVDAYFALVRRGGLTDLADTTSRRLMREIRGALPNSLRTPSSQCVEFIPTKTGGRYRVNDLTAGDGTGLDFSTSDSRFNMLGSNAAMPADQRIVAGDVIAVFNLGIAGADAYSLENVSSVSSVGTETGSPLETPIFISAMKFPMESPSHRFDVISATEKVVSFVCSGGNLYRTASSSFYAATSPSACPTSGAILARNVSFCNFDYTGSDLQRNALLSILLQFTDSGETVGMLQDVHVSNAP